MAGRVRFMPEISGQKLDCGKISVCSRKRSLYKKLAFYVEHTMKSVPMDIDNLNNQMGFIRSDEAGKFMAFLAGQNIRGAVDGSAEGTRFIL